VTSRRYRLTRDLPMGEPGNFFPRDLMAGEIVYRCDGAYAVTNVDLNIGACVTEDPDGGYPGYQVPLSAVEDQFWQADTAHDHSWAQDMEEVAANCPDYNPDLKGTGIRCPGDPAASGGEG
jgi:hypothetical protein